MPIRNWGEEAQRKRRLPKKQCKAAKRRQTAKNVRIQLRGEAIKN
jgi:hypothetical protein